MIKTLTFEVKDREEELALLSAVLRALGQRDYTEAHKLLIARIDKLTEKPKLRPYP